jgi:hypothetical protein
MSTVSSLRLTPPGDRLPALNRALLHIAAGRGLIRRTVQVAGQSTDGRILQQLRN